MFPVKSFIAAAALAAIAGAASAAEPIVIGQTAAFTGAPAPSVIEMTAGAKLVIDAENAKGGINGRPIELVSVDDGSDAKRAVANTEKLIAERKPVAMFLSRGTPITEAMLPVLEKTKVPLIAPSTGAMSLRTPANPLVFNVRSSYRKEARKAVEQFSNMGVTKLGVIYVDDTFGADAFVGVKEGLVAKGVQPLFVEKFDRTAKDFTQLVATVAAAQPPAVVLVGAAGATSSIVKKMHEAGLKCYVATLSTNASHGFMKDLGPNGQFVIVSQVFPNERSTSLPLVREMTDLVAAAKGKTAGADGPAGEPSTAVAAMLNKGVELSPAMLEGAVSAKVLIAGLRRASAPTPAKLVAALDSGFSIDVGWPGYEIKYGPTSRMGLEFAELSIVSSDTSRPRFSR